MSKNYKKAKNAKKRWVKVKDRSRTLKDYERYVHGNGGNLKDSKIYCIFKNIFKNKFNYHEAKKIEIFSIE